MPLSLQMSPRVRKYWGITHLCHKYDTELYTKGHGHKCSSFMMPLSLQVLPRVLKDWGITHLCYEVDTEPYAKVRDAAARAAAEAAGAQVCALVSHTLYVSDGGRPLGTGHQMQGKKVE